MEVKVFGEGIERVGVRAITDNIYWVTHCLGDHAREYYLNYFEMLPNADEYTGQRVVDYPFSAFLILDEKNLLIDTGAPTQRENTMRAIEHLLGERTLDYIWISHMELPHAGNAVPINRRYPHAQLVTAGGGDQYYTLHGLTKALQVSPGDVLELGRHTLEMIDPVFLDHGFSQWAYERHSGMFVSIDWAHNLHEPAKGQCFQFLDEMMAGDYTPELYVDDVRINAWYQFPWLAFTDPDEIAAAVDRVFEEYDVRIFAPSHGNIIRKDVQNYVGYIREGMRQAAEMPFYLGPD